MIPHHRSNYKVHQTGTRKSKMADYSRKAITPGWRMSSSGNWYYESRKNRSDMPKSRL